MSLRRDPFEEYPLVKWGNYDEDMEAELAVKEAKRAVEEAKDHLAKVRRVYRTSTPRRPSSAKRSSEVGKLGRKDLRRKAHFTRKAIKEARKEQERRARWMEEFGHVDEARWDSAERHRKERKRKA